MKNWFWRRFVILLLAVTLPLSAVSMSLASPCPMETHSGMFDASVTSMSVDTVDECERPAQCEMENEIQCADMAHSCASCVTIVNLAAAIAPLAKFPTIYPASLELTFFVPPLLERPPTLDDSFA